MTNKVVQVILVLSLISFIGISSCNEKKSRLEYALDFAGDNRGKLSKVLEHYSGDSLKLKAARFLIENMPYYYSYTGSVLDSLKAIKASVDENGKLPDEKVNPLKNFDYTRLPKVYDAHVITAKYLIENIDLAFMEWKKRPWNKYYTFDEFCELILPYRIDNEPLENWRRTYHEKFTFLLDSVYTGTDIIKAANVIGKYLREDNFIFNRNLNLPHLGAEFLLKHKVGKCMDSCDYLIYVLRALGIPVTVDELPLSPDNLMGHTWNIVLDTTQHYVPFWFTEKDAVRCDRYEDGRKKGKVLRKCFGMQPELFEGISRDMKVPAFFKDRFKKDVSGEYFRNRHEIPSKDPAEKYMYIGIFTPTNWVPIDMAQVNNGKAVFSNIEADIAYQPLYYNGTEYLPAGYPFVLKGDSAITFIPDKEESESIVVTRKCPLYKRIVWHMSKVIDARIYSSVSEDFQHSSRLLHHIKEIPKKSINVVCIAPPARCRYIRYVAPVDSFVEIAGLDFYFKKQQIEPVGICENEHDRKLPPEKLLECLDHDPLTWISTKQKGGYITIDFGKEVHIDHLVYTPRNDDNFIRIGDLYEIGYNDGYNGWKYIARQRATTDTLVFQHIPKGALLHLRNLTRGKEEKVFYIENGKQVFP